jgi:hypothetical protein
MEWPLGFSPDGSRAALLRYTGDNGSLLSGTALLEWVATADGKPLAQIPLGAQRHCHGAALAPDALRLITCRVAAPFQNGCRLLLRDVATGAVLTEAPVDLVSAHLLGWSPDGAWIVAGEPKLSGSKAGHQVLRLADNARRLINRQYRDLLSRSTAAPSL